MVYMNINKPLTQEVAEMGALKLKPKTNVKLITDLMEFSSHGALMQIFVVCGIERYAEMVLAELKENPDSWDNSLVDRGAWMGCAEEVLRAMKERG